MSQPPTTIFVTGRLNVVDCSYFLVQLLPCLRHKSLVHLGFDLAQRQLYLFRSISELILKFIDQMNAEHLSIFLTVIFQDIETAEWHH